MRKQFGGPLYALLGLTALVLLVACVCPPQPKHPQPKTPTPPPAHALRYRTTAERSFYRALAELLRLRTTMREDALRQEKNRKQPFTAKWSASASLPSPEPASSFRKPLLQPRPQPLSTILKPRALSSTPKSASSKPGSANHRRMSSE